MQPRYPIELNINNPLRQRMAVKYFMRGLEAGVGKDYCSGRLKKAGANELM